jgi:hypothetical protein
MVSGMQCLLDYDIVCLQETCVSQGYWLTKQTGGTLQRPALTAVPINPVRNCCYVGDISGVPSPAHHHSNGARDNWCRQDRDNVIC